ncbi:TolB family protein [Acetivibrio saccincola]|uniref:TolB family protein n=2 Tax=Acetivibrio saccincola TaxID=1677857 RepID=UPI002C6E389E|nr:hypothetical protein [Acetivibrio saccincola]HQD28335.1 hypothetical protein [Acetivibrio saccincola]
MNSKRKYQKTIILMAVILICTTIGTLFFWNLTKAEESKTLVLPPKENELWNPVLSKTVVTGVKTFKMIPNKILGYLEENNILLRNPMDKRIPEPIRNRKLCIYDAYNDGYKDLFLSDDSRIEGAAVVGISPDRTKLLISDKILGILLSDKDYIFEPSEKENNCELYIYDLATDSSYKITEFLLRYAKTFNGVGWSDDGGYITYCLKRDEEKTYDFFVYDIAEKKTEKYTLSEEADKYSYIDLPKYSKEGQCIFFIGGGNSGSKLYKIDLTEEIPKVEWLADDVAFYNVLKDEKNIVFLNSLREPRTLKRGVYFLDIETKEIKTLSEYQTKNHSGYDISPDGNRIVYFYDCEGSIDVKVATLSGKGIKDSTTIYKMVNNPSDIWWRVLWNGNGTKVLLSSNKSMESSDELENYIIELEYK